MPRCEADFIGSNAVSLKRPTHNLRPYGRDVNYLGEETH